MADINAHNIIPEFREADFQFVVQNNPLGNLYYRTPFPLKYSTGLTFGSIESETGAKVVADIVAMGSNVPLKARQFAEKIKGEIPKLEVGRAMYERDFFRLNELRNAVSLYPSNIGVKQELINAIYGDARFVIDSVNAGLELMSKKLLSTGGYQSNGVKIDFSVRTKNASKNWFTATDFDPIQDFKDIQNEAEEKGFQFTQAIMDRATFNQLVKAESVKKFTATFVSNVAGVLTEPTLAQLNNALELHGLPKVVVWNTFVAEEDKAGNIVSTSGWQLGNIHFATDDIGNTQYTISPEASITLGNETSKATNDNFILVSVLGQANPMQVITKGMAFATPVLNNVSKKLILKTKI
ncbi:MAG: major capsid protein [Bergeyella cardium]